MNAAHRQLLGFALILGVGGTALAADWPQFLGPNRDGVSTETGLVQSWPKDGPPVVWQQKIGEGFSGPVVAGERLILFHRVENNEVVACLDAVTGKERWKCTYPTSYEDQLGKGDGPRATPVIAGNRVYTLGAEGALHCLELDTGKKVWERPLLKDYRVPPSYFGIGSTPLIEGDLVLVNVGDKKAGIVAFHKDSGKEVWRATSDGASYASPTAATIDGTRLGIFFTRQGVVLLDPKTGAVRYQKRWRARYDASVNAATPLVIGDLVFVSTCYETGALLLKVRKDGVDEVWSGDEGMSNHYNTCVQHKGYLYGFHGRQETGAALRCVELKTGKVRWTEARYGCGSMVLADGNLIILTEKGDLVLAEATPDAYREKARARVLSGGPIRAQIALANGRLYARDGERLVCWNLKK
ncbi:MAG TPA: PQQ-binding-like beta-propeller repeat protein [Gemmataceae bacterium]|nr:PQQ-binding-like beta-propeller repeat protein [Gemmataceae bacterium]